MSTSDDENVDYWQMRSLGCMQRSRWISLGAYFSGIYIFILPFAHTIALRYTALTIAAAIAGAHWRALSVPRLSISVKLALGWWILAVVMGIAVSPDFNYSLRAAKVEVLYGLAGFLVLYAFAQNKQRMLIFVWALSLSTFTLSVLGIIHFARQGSWGDGYHNFVGNFSSCILVTLPLLPLAVCMTGVGRRKHAYLALTLVIGTALLASLLSLSRMFWVALVPMVGTAVVLAVGRFFPAERRRNYLIVGLVFAFALGTGGFLYVSKVKGSNITNDPRIDIWRYSVTQIAQSPVLGLGYGRDLRRNLYRDHFPATGILHPHNLILSILEQTGFFGLASFTALIGTFVLLFWRFYLSNVAEAAIVGIAGLVMILGFFVKNMSDMFFIKEIALLFWAAIGCLLGYGTRLMRPTD